MAPKRHSIGDNMEQVVSRNDVHQSMQLPYSDNWISDNWVWSKRHRSQEVMLSDSTYRKGNQTICCNKFLWFFVDIHRLANNIHNPFSNVPFAYVHVYVKYFPLNLQRYP